MSSKQTRLSDRRRSYQTALRDTGKNVSVFMHNLRGIHHNSNALEHFADKSRNGGDQIELMVAECLIEAALLSADDNQILRCSDKANTRLAGLIEKADTFSIVSSDMIRARILNAYQPFFGMLALTKQLPPPPVGRRVYNDLTDVGSDVSSNWGSYYKEFRQQGESLNGIGSELTTLLLLQRFTVQQVGDGSWWPAPTTISDARLDRGGGAQNGNWDINCFTQLEDLPELSYKLEVKSSEAAKQRSRTYDDDIAVVSLREDVLTSAKGRPWGVSSALSLFEHEQQGATTYCRHPGDVLNAMSGRLLDALDQ